jgi:hypothetical protein
MSRLFRFLASGGIVLLLVTALAPSIALAHQRKAEGSYNFLVGWLNEPAIQGEPNGLDLTVTDAKGQPVDGAEKTLKVAIAYGGGQPTDIPLSARFGLHGKYTAQVIPTKAGSYSFVFSGSVNGQPINDRFDSGPNTFDDVASPASYQFPEVVPAGADLAAQAQAAQGAAQRATILGIAGVVVGVLGLILGGVALLVRPRSTVAPSEVETPSGVEATSG